MNIREATEFDRFIWDDFVNTQGGNFHKYFGWKYIYETTGQLFFPLMVENNQSQLVAIFPLIKEEHKLFSILYSRGFEGILFRESLSSDDKHKITLALIKYIDRKYSSRCSQFSIIEQLPLNFEKEENQALIESGFRIRNIRKSGLPCSHILPLKAPFEEHIWKGLWSQKLRQALNKVEKSGVKVIQDREQKYIEEYVKMLIANYKRHKIKPPTRDYILSAFRVFRNNTKLFVALKYNQPIAILSCIYTPSTCYLWGIGTYTKDTNDINKYCYKVAIQDACNEGYLFVDFLGAFTAGLSNLKKRFGTKQTPMMEYEKTYSLLRVLLQRLPTMDKLILFNPKYLWEHRVTIWDRIWHW
jgi:hypothetical protein